MKILTLQDIPDLKCDSCVANNDSELIFMSIWGRETAIQELFAKLTLGETSKHGLSVIQFTNYNQVRLAEGQHYAKRTLKLNKTQFGALIHAFIFDKRIIEPNRDSNSMITLFKSDFGSLIPCYFDAVKLLTSIPLLDHWADEIVLIAEQQEMINEHKPIVGDIYASTITVDDITLTQSVSQKIRAGSLTLS